MTSESIRYTLRFPNAKQHLVEIEIFFPSGIAKARTASQGKSSTFELCMPTWTPGSYLIREYARHVESISAYEVPSGKPLVVRKATKCSWQMACNEDTPIRVRYTLYCRELSVRTNWIDEEYAFLTGAATFLTRSDALNMPHEVAIEPIESWPSIACSLPSVEDTSQPLIQSFTRTASSYHELVDSPFLMGKLKVTEFAAGGRNHYLASFGTGPNWDAARATQDIARIVNYQHRFWGCVPYPSYWFLHLALEGYGGLEHDNNTVLLSNRWVMGKSESYLEWLGLVSHEFFHTWNVRRLRPRGLMKYDYHAEQFVEELWIAEGITSYLDDLIVLRSGLATPDNYLGLLNKTIQAVEDTPGRKVQSLRDASWDTWIKHYRPDENTPNSRVSYYTKGAVVAFLLDIKIREISNDRVCLDDVMRKLWEANLSTGYTLDSFEMLVSELVNEDLKLWFDAHVRQASQLDYRQAFAWLGLEQVDGGQVERDWGIDVASRDGRWIVTRVLREGSGSSAGLQVDDELIAIDGWRFAKDHWRERLQQANTPTAKLTIARRGKLVELSIDDRPKSDRKLRFTEKASALQRNRRKAWLYSGCASIPPCSYFD